MKNSIGFSSFICLAAYNVMIALPYNFMHRWIGEFFTYHSADDFTRIWQELLLLSISTTLCGILCLPFEISSEKQKKKLRKAYSKGISHINHIPIKQ